ncbi:MAG: LptF/LptG family permease [Gemmatimonadaceae bacterium]|nr:LptF/LptG family permease [Gemmatimonadaceae bacterium]
MKILTKYVLKEHVGPFIFAVTALTSLMLLQYIGKRLGDLVGKGLPWRVLVEFFMLSIPFTVAMTLPMAVLVAVLYAYTRMASENEITAMRATGMSMRSLLIPTLLAGTAVAVVMLAFNDQVLSRANHQLAVLQDDISRTKPSFALKEQVINTIVDQKFYLRAARIDRASQHMQGVTIWDLSNPAHRRTIYADSGTLGVAENRLDLLMHLYDGVMVEVPTAQPKQYTRMFYASDVLRLRNVTNSFTATDADSAAKSDREMTVCEMQAKFADFDYQLQQANYDRMEAQAQLLAAAGEQHVQWPAKPVRRNPFGLGKIYCALLDRIFGVKRAEAATLPVRQQPPRQQPPAAQAVRPPPPPAQAPGQAPAQQAETTHVGPPTPQPAQEQLTAISQRAVERVRLEGQREVAAAREKAARYERIRYDIEIQKKFSLAAACIIFVLLGPPIALRFPRGGVGLVIGVSFAVFALYYVGLIGGETLANDQIISPFWAMWAANIVLLVVGISMTLRMNRVTGATRGGDWSELRVLFARWVRRLAGRAPRSAT